MITEYLVCSNANIPKLQELVNQAIKNGWQPFGGVAMTLSMSSVNDKPVATTYFCQAVVKVTAK
jgi:hypothetical protein